ncbi:MAG: Alpha-L-fucosidase [Herbinix sp.]|nr:Alpha-L-fucosidase [Herbinix sp.]
MRSEKEFIEQITAVVPTKNQLEWQRLEFTAFFHYGINSFTDREWGTGTDDISLFQPRRLNTDQWCESLKRAEIKACIITAKHHDGFCLWNTTYTKHSVMHTPFQRDIVKELSISCQKYGIKLGIYLSPWDKHEETYGQGKAYDDYFCNQLTELMTNYGELYTVWFDGACGEGPNGKKQIYDWNRYYNLIRKLQPNAVISVSGPDVRWCGNEAGDCRASEWSVVPAKLFSQKAIAEASQQEDNDAFRDRKINEMDQDLGSRAVLEQTDNYIWYPAEVDTSIRPGWFYHESEDDKVRSIEELRDIYLKSVGGNSVLLLNIPPHKDGYLTEFDVMRLQELGDFIRDSFDNSVYKDFSISANQEEEGYEAINLLENNERSWKPKDYAPEAEIVITFNKAKCLSYLVIMEQITYSQRIEEFSLYLWVEDAWKLEYRGTTIGYKKICPLENIMSDKIKIVFDAYRKCPIINHIGIYGQEA